MPSAVFEVPKTTVLAAWAIGSAAWAEFDSVGPKTISTLSWKISFLKTLIASSFLPCSSSIDQLDLVAVDAAGGVDLVGRELEAVADARAVLRGAARQGFGRRRS